MMNFSKAILIMATCTVGLVAGVFFAFQVAINPAFLSMGDIDYIQAMQYINKAIVNPMFAVCFVGGPAFLLWAMVIHVYRPLGARARWLLVAACSIYLLGGLGVTVFENIPLNDSLANFVIEESSVEQIALVRSNFAKEWNNWHTIRTVASVMSFILLIMACFNRKSIIISGKYTTY